MSSLVRRTHTSFLCLAAVRFATAALPLVALLFCASPAAVAQPANDNFINAEFLNGPSGTVFGSTIGATVEPGEPFHYGPYRAHSVWYRWTPSVTGFVTFDTLGTYGFPYYFDTVMAAYTGSQVNQLFKIASNDESFILYGDSLIGFIANAGVEYHIAIDGYINMSGPFQMHWFQANGTNAVAATNAVEFSTPIYTVAENSPGFITVAVISPGGFTNTSTVDYQTVDGTAIAGQDYLSVSNRLTFEPGDTLKAFTIPILDNSLQDSNRTFNVVLTNPTGDAALGFVSNAVVTITDDESAATLTPAGQLNVVVTNSLAGFIGGSGIFFFGQNLASIVTEDETFESPWGYVSRVSNRSVKGALVTVTRTLPAAGRILVDYYTTNTFLTNIFFGTNIYSAQPGFDYTPASGTLMFDDYQTMANIVIPVDYSFFFSTNSTVFQTPVFFDVVLANPRPAPEEDPTIIAPTLGNRQGSVEIIKINNYRGYSIERTTYRADEYDSFSRGGTNVVLPDNLHFMDVDIILPGGGPGSVDLAINFAGYYLQPGSDYVDVFRDLFDNTPYTDGSPLIFNYPDTVQLETRAYRDSPTVTGYPQVRVDFPDASYTRRTVRVWITNDFNVEFNEDIALVLVNPRNNLGVGNDFATGTILFNDQPAGAADREWDPEGVVYTNPSFNSTPGANNTVAAVAVQPDDRTLIGGDFDHVNGILRKHVARLNTDGSLDSSFNPGTGADDSVDTLLLYPPTSADFGKVLIGGAFTSFNGARRNGIARLNADGTLDSSFSPGNGANGIVRAIALQNDGRIIVAGDFTTFNDLNVNGIMRINPDGSLDRSFDPGLGANGAVWAIVVHETADRTIYVAGDFTDFNGAPRNRLARLTDTGAVDPLFDTGLGTDGSIYALALQADGKILIGGAFSSYHIFPRSSIARINIDGSLDESYNVGAGFNDSVYTLALQPDGKAVAGGVFTSYNNTRRMGMARLFTSGSLDTSFMDTAYNQFAGLPRTFFFDNPSFVNSLALQSDGNIMIGGSFTNLGGNLSVHHPVVTNQLGTLTNFFISGLRPDSINGRTNGHNSGAHLYAPFTRQDKTTRFNVARVLGGYTPGPGNIEYDPASAPFVADENSGHMLIALRRVDGRLGTAAAQPSTTNNTATFPFDFSSVTSTQVWSEFRATINAVAQGVFSPRSVGFVGKTYFDVPVSDDVLQEGDETFGLILSNTFGSITLGGEYIPVGAAVGHLDGSYGTIADNDFNHGIFSFAIANYVTNENAAYAVISVVRTNGTSGSASVDYFTRTGPVNPATPGVDYTTARGTLRFASGQSASTFNVPILNNPEVEQDETVGLVLTNATGGAKLPGGNATSVALATLTIVDDDFLPGRLQFSTDTYTNNENDVTAVITVTRSGGSVGAMSVQYSTLPGTATPNTDYTAVSGTLVWADGDGSPKKLNIPLLADGVVEGPESVLLRLSNPSVNGALGSRSNAVLWITDGDAYGLFSLSQPFYEANENGIYPTITVLRSRGSAGTVSIDFATAPIIAVPGTDYRDTNGTLVFLPNEFSKSFRIPIIDNAVPDGDRTLQISLFNPTNGACGDITNAFLTIVDNESVNLPAGSLDTTFSSQAAADGAVYSLLLQEDGRIIVAGDFTHISSVPRNHIARLKPGGTLDATFDIGAGANEAIRALALQSDGRLLVGGLFSSVSGTNRNGIARLSTDGTLDVSFNPGAGADNPIYALIVQPNDKVLVGGAFSTFNGIVRPGLVRLNTNGVVDSSFDLQAGFNGVVYAIALQNDGKVIVGGEFVSVNGVARTNLVRLNANGSLDSTFPSVALNGAVRAIHVQPDGAVVVGGSFSSVNGLARGYIARFLANGVLDTGFLSGLSGGDNTVYAIKQQGDGKLVVAGDFRLFNGVTRNGITRIQDTDGSTDPSINFGNGANAFVSSIAIQPDRRILLGGGFTTYDDQPRQHLARIYGGSIEGSGALEFSAPLFTATEAGTNAVISVRRRGGTTGSVSANYATSDASALAGRDYRSSTGTLVFPEGETRRTFNVPIIRNNVADGDRTLNLSLNNFVGANVGPQPFAVLAIIDDESTVGFAYANYAVNEVTVSSNATIALVRAGGTNTTVTVGVRTVDGTAVAGLDYIGTNGLVTFLPGETTKNFNVAVLDDLLIEGNETLSLVLTNASGATALSISNATLTIIDNEFGAGQFLFVTNSYVVDEFAGVATVTVLRTNGASGIVSVRIATSDGTARATQDYISTNRVLTFADGETVKSFNIPIINDTIIEGNETFFVSISNPTGGTTLGGVTNASILVIDDESGVQFESSTYAVAEDDGFVHITVVHSGNTNLTASVNFTTVPGSATSPADFIGTNGTLVFPPGVASLSFDIRIVPDNVVETNESFTVVLSNPSGNVQIGVPPVATVSISDSARFVAFDTTTYVVNEGDTNASITLRRYGLPTRGISVFIRTIEGSALESVDYVPVTNIVKFAAGETNKTVLIPIVDDGLAEGAEFLGLELFNPTNAAVGVPAAAILTILDNDPGPGFADSTFNVGIGANKFVRSVALQGDGRVLIGGAFTNFAGFTNRNYLARVSTNGVYDPSFDPGSGPNGLVSAIATSPDNHIVIGGAFTTVNGTNFARLARLGTNGSLDPLFSAPSRLDASVNGLDVQADNRIVVGGSFSSPVHGLGRFRINGTSDLQFDTGGGADAIVYAVNIQPDGTILAAGTFTNFGGFSYPRLVRVGSGGLVDVNMTPLAITNGVINTIARGPNSTILIGGSFRFINGFARSGVARLNWDGSLDLTFDPGAGANGIVYTVGCLADGRVFIGGDFTSVNGMGRNRYALLAPDGSVDLGFDSSSGADGVVYSSTIQPDQKVIIGGDFTTIAGVTNRGVARINVGEALPLSIGTPRLVAGAATFSVSTIGGYRYVLERSTNMVYWSSLSTNTATSPSVIFSDPAGSVFAHRYYRIRRLEP